MFFAVQNVTISQANCGGTSASVTYFTHDCARLAVTKMSHAVWSGSEINAVPNRMDRSVHNNKQICKLKAVWFLTESQGTGRIQFNQKQAAQQAYKLFQSELSFRCYLLLNSMNPTVKCIWFLARHFGTACIVFRTTEHVDQVSIISVTTIDYYFSFQALARKYEYSFCLSRSLKNNTMLTVRNIPQNLDEEDLKEIFSECINVLMRRNFKETQVIGVEDKLVQLFNRFQSFQRELLLFNPEACKGRCEAYASFSNEQDMHDAIADMNGKSNLIGCGKLRISIQEKSRSMTNLKNQESTMKKDGYIIKLAHLPSHVDEEFLVQQLNRKNLSDYMTNVTVFRKKLPQDNSTSLYNIKTEKNLQKLRSFFSSSKKKFCTEPDIKAYPPTDDGRVVAFILFKDPLDTMKAIDIYNIQAGSNLLKIDQFQFQLMPIFDHRIIINYALMQTMPHKIQQAINMIKNDLTFSNVKLITTVTIKDNQETLHVSIKGQNIKVITKARTIFDDLMKGLKFKLNHPSWVKT